MKKFLRKAVMVITALILALSLAPGSMRYVQASNTPMFNDNLGDSWWTDAFQNQWLGYPSDSDAAHNVLTSATTTTDQPLPTPVISLQQGGDGRDGINIQVEMYVPHEHLAGVLPVRVPNNLVVRIVVNGQERATTADFNNALGGISFEPGGEYQVQVRLDVGDESRLVRVREEGTSVFYFMWLPSALSNTVVMNIAEEAEPPRQLHGAGDISQVFTLTNAERVNRGLSPLEMCGTLAAAALGHSSDMAANNFTGHDSSDGRTFEVRFLAAAGDLYSDGGENVGSGWMTPEEIVDGWMNSPKHRDNILNPRFTHLGVGLATGGDPNHSHGPQGFWTQKFGGGDGSPQELSAPVLHVDGVSLSWTPIDDADFYVVTFSKDPDYEREYTTEEIGLNLEEDIELEPGTYTIHVVAGHDGRIARSAPSNTVTFTVGEEETTDDDDDEDDDDNDNDEYLEGEPPEWSDDPLETDSGVLLDWEINPDNRYGYRVFRATCADSEGVSISEDPINIRIDGDTARIITFDPNARPGGVYYYYIREVLAPNPEELGPPSERRRVVVPGEYEPCCDDDDCDNDCGAIPTRGFIMKWIESSQMNVNNDMREIDPGRGTYPVIRQGRTMLPVRAVVEAMTNDDPDSVGWDGGESRVDLAAQGNIVSMWIGRTDALVNGASADMDVAPSIENARTLLPVRFVAEFLGTQIEWIASERLVIIVYNLP
ncbi:MAG: stalk domain-containing protein [Defluviitaleaceae bacterium]|nr:stalk domain-containing protein [Defluviitaleaceae bacterium]